MEETETVADMGQTCEKEKGGNYQNYCKPFKSNSSEEKAQIMR